MKDNPNKKPTWKQLFKDICGEFAIQIAFLGLFLLVANVYFAYIAFGFGAFFLILPFGVIFYNFIKKYCIKHKINH